jgi:hypothetical protein
VSPDSDPALPAVARILKAHLENLPTYFTYSIAAFALLGIFA